MKVRIAIFVLVIAGSAFGIHKVNEFRNSPSGQLIETLQERKQLIEEYTKSPIIQPPLNK
jgi:UDP-N-acetyl-D-mannosaminuronate dehydrogenase